MPLPELAGALGVKRAAHLLRRAAFGATKAQIDTFAAYSPAQAINELFHKTLPDPVLPVDPKTGMEWFTSGTTDASSKGFELENFFKQWFLGQMLSTGVPTNLSLAYATREKMVYFLHTHFTAIAEKIGSSRALYFQNQLFRLYALDASTADADVNFKTLTKKISVDNGMLKLLDGVLNVKGAPNENYGRELIELYSIGRGLEIENYIPPSGVPGDYGIYTEDDVKAAARVLSGWNYDDTFKANIDPDTLLPRGVVKGSPTNASAHDIKDKEFSARLGSQVINGDPLLMNGGNATEESAYDEIDQLIELLYTQPETAKNICRKIYRFFVFGIHKEVDLVAIDNSIIAEMASTFAASGYKLQLVVENLLKSQHFYEGMAGYGDDNIGAIIKSPIDLAVGTIRFFNLPVPTMANPAEFYDFTGTILSAINLQGMSFYQPYDVSGYDAYSQFPIYHRSWITVTYLTQRYNFINRMTNPSGDYAIKVALFDFVKATFDNAIIADAPSLVIELAKYILPVPDSLTFDANADGNSTISAERLLYFLKKFLSVYDEATWTTVWNSQSQIDTLRGQLMDLFNAMMQSPEYQLG